MDRLLKPERLDSDPNSSFASKEWTHWLKTFQNFMSVLPTEGLNKLCVLTNYVPSKHHSMGPVPILLWLITTIKTPLLALISLNAGLVNGE